MQPSAQIVCTRTFEPVDERMVEHVACEWQAVDPATPATTAWVMETLFPYLGVVPEVGRVVPIANLAVRIVAYHPQWRAWAVQLAGDDDV